MNLLNSSVNLVSSCKAANRRVTAHSAYSTINLTTTTQTPTTTNSSPFTITPSPTLPWESAKPLVKLVVLEYKLGLEEEELTEEVLDVIVLVEEADKVDELT